MTFDYAYQPVIYNNLLYIGNSNDCKIYAINRKTGVIKWSFFTDGPVRFAPAVYKNKLYAVSDDGNIYCLSAKTGKLRWKKYGGHEPDMVLGNERLISRWPVRGGLVIKDDILYVGAGIWPSEKIFIYALNPDNGEVIWLNDSSGGMEIPQPHGGAIAESGLSAQGYLTIGGDKLFIPTGRAVPAALNIESGEFEYFHLQEYRNFGGSEIMAIDSFLFVPGGNTRDMNEIQGTRYAVFSNNDGKIIPRELKSEAIAISPDYLYCINNDAHRVEAYLRENICIHKETIDRRGEKVMVSSLSDPVWSTDLIKDYVKTLIISGNRLIAGTTTEKILIIDSEDGRLISSYKVNGIPLGLAVAQKSLFVSTSKGILYCLDNSSGKSPRVFYNNFTDFTTVSDAKFENAANEIISKSGVKNGYCLDLECGDGSLVYELAKKTNLRIIALDKDKKNVDRARKKLSNAGLYGSRVLVLHGDINTLPLPDFFANLIVSQRSVSSGSSDHFTSQSIPCQRPCGGVIITGIPGEMKMSVRGELEGAGEWTHQYHDPANTAISEDEIVNVHLEVLWFKDSEFDMPSRHGRGVAPLYKEGRLFVAGKDGIRAVDAYNGHLLWEYYIRDLQVAFDQEHLLGTAITQGNWCIEGERLFVRRGISSYNRAAKDCYVLDTKTGSRIATFNTPNGGYWGYIAVKNGILYGSVANEEHIVTWGYRESDMNNQFSESGSVFALDVSSGEILWEYKAKNSIRHNSIAIGNDKLYLIDRPLADIDKYYRRGSTEKTDDGVLVALDPRTGKVLYRKKDNIWGTLLILNEKYNKLIMSYTDTRYKLPSEKGGKIAVLDAETGNLIWESKTRQ